MTIINAFCELPFKKLILNGFGDVVHCCYQLDRIGNILEEGVTVMDLWNSPRAKEIRETTLKGKFHSSCIRWNTCPYIVNGKVPYNFEANEDYPQILEICLPNTHCNIGGEKPSDESPACIMCCRNFDFKPQPNHTDLLCEKAKPVIPYLNRLVVLGIAEPFWKDAIFRVLDKVGFEEYRDNIVVETNTNVTCMFPKNTDKWFEKVSRSELSFSLDAATSSTYHKIRRIDGFEHLMDYISYYTAKRKQFGDAHKVKIYNNINMLNVDEMVMMVEMAVECDVDEILLIPTHDQCGRAAALGELLLNKKNLKYFSKNADLATKRAEELGMKLVMPKSFHIPPPPVGTFVDEKNASSSIQGDLIQISLDS